VEYVGEPAVHEAEIRDRPGTDDARGAARVVMASEEERERPLR
jgi:hypothetical protein